MPVAKQLPHDHTMT